MEIGTPPGYPYIWRVYRYVYVVYHTTYGNGGTLGVTIFMGETECILELGVPEVGKARSIYTGVIPVRDL